MKKKLDEKEQKYLKGISKALYILSKIGKICAVIGMAFVVLFLIGFLFLFNKMEYKENTLFVNKEKIVTLKEDINGVDLEFYDKKYDVVKLNENDKLELIKFKKFLDNDGLKTICLYVEIGLVGACAILFVIRMILRKLELLFKNISTLNTPFKEENSLLLKNIITLIIIQMGISILFSIVLGFIWDYDINFGFKTTSIFELLVVFVLYYVCKYGCLLQKDSKLSIYENTNE